MNGQTKAEKAAIRVANIHIDQANAFYLYHKDIIDEYERLCEIANEASHKVTIVKINRIQRGDFDKPNTPTT